MKIYLAAAWSRQLEIRAVAAELNELPGIQVVSRWLNEPTLPPRVENIDEFRQSRAVLDLEDVLGTEVLVRFTDDLSAETVPSRLASGARMFEMGYAYATQKKVVVVGGHQPIFDYLPEIIHVNDVEELKAWILENNRG